MNCFPELTYSIYADGELPPQEARLVEAHLFMCPHCRSLVETLQAESRMLSMAIKEAGEAPAAAGIRLGRSLLWTTLSAVGLVLILNGVGSWLVSLIPGLAEWVNPMNRTTFMNLFFSGALYVADEGSTLLQSFVATLTVLLVVIGVGGALYFVLRRGSRSISMAVLTGMTLMMSMASPVSAVEHRKGKTVTVPAGETVEGTLVATGQDVTIDGTVNGDLIVAGGEVAVHGTVKGDVLDAGHSLDIDGNVTGNVFTFAQTLAVRGTIGRNLYGWIQTIQLESNGRVGGDVIVGSGVLDLSGEVVRDAVLFCGNVHLRGKVGRNLDGYTSDITLTPSARVGGDLTLHTHHSGDAHIEPGATIGGKTQIELEKPEPSRYSSRHFYFWEAVLLAGAFVVGLMLNWLLPQSLRTRLDTASSALSACGTGFLILVATPIAALILCCTLIGLPLGIITLLAWLVALYLAKVFVAALIGEGLTKRNRVPGRPGSFALALLLGLFIISVAMELPFVGGWIKLLAVLLGLGLLYRSLRSAWTRRAAPVPAA